jgi:hypothetical protein
MIAEAVAPTSRTSALSRAFERAKAERLLTFRNEDGTWSCKSYTLTVTGERPQDVACSCPAGTRGLICKHAVLVMFCRKHHVRPIRPVKPVMVNGMDRNDPLWDAFN